MHAQVTKLCEFPGGEGGDSVCSVSWSQRGTYLSVGTNNGEVQIWDVAKVKLCAHAATLLACMLTSRMQ
jgi:cell division cycle 20-like protein 1 (cofactor of APC complex)